MTYSTEKAFGSRRLHQVPLPPHVAELMRLVPPALNPNPNYFFWSGNNLPKLKSGKYLNGIGTGLRLYVLIDYP
jgi:hypothetical protein